MTMDDEFVIDLSETEVQELEAAYGLTAPKAAKAPASAKAEAATSAKSEAAPAKAGDDLMRRIVEAESRVQAERAKRIEAEKLAHERGTSAAINAARAAESDFHAVANALNKATSEAEALKVAHRAALEAGDYEKVSEVSSKMAEAAARIAQLSDGKAALEGRVREAKTQAETAAKAEPPKVEASGDPLDRFLEQSQMPPRAQSWFRSHPECAPVNNPALYHKALAAHYEIIKAGVADGSDAYYDKLDAAMGFSGEGSDEVVVNTKKAADTAADDVVVDTAAKSAPKATPPPRVAAPVSRDSSIVTRRADGRMQIRLTREQAEMAEHMGMSPSAYAKQLLKAEQEGRLNRA